MIENSPKNRRKFLRAFTLVELLVVISIMVVLGAAVGPGISGALEGVNLTGGAGKVVDELEFARQTALSRNSPVEVRIYQEDGTIRRVASLLQNTSGIEWLSPGRPLPQGVLIDDSPTFSTLLGQGTTVEASVDVPVGLRGLIYHSFSFRPDGTTSLTMGQEWTLTVRNTNVPAAEQTATRPADNFITVSIDPMTGRTSAFQP